MGKRVFEFQLQGTNDGKIVFSIITNEGWYYYKLDENFDIDRTSYVDTDLSACNTTVRSVDGQIQHSKVHLVTREEAQALVARLTRENVLLDGLGYFSDFDYKVRVAYPFAIKHETGRTSYSFYSGTTVQEAIKHAVINSPIMVGIELYKGDINQEPFNRSSY